MDLINGNEIAQEIIEELKMKFQQFKGASPASYLSAWARIPPLFLM